MSMMSNRDPDGPNNARSSSLKARAAACRRESDKRFSSLRRASLSSGSALARVSLPSERGGFVVADVWLNHGWSSVSLRGTWPVKSMCLHTRTAEDASMSATPRQFRRGRTYLSGLDELSRWKEDLKPVPRVIHRPAAHAIGMVLSDLPRFDAGVRR